MEQSKLIKLLWSVIAVLVIGFAAVTVIAWNRSAAIDQARVGHQGDLDSLKEQLKQAKQPHPSTPPLSESVSNAATPSPSPTPISKATATPKPK